MEKTDVEKINSCFEVYEKALESLKGSQPDRLRPPLEREVELLSQGVGVSLLYQIALQLAKLNENIEKLRLFS